MIQLLLTLNDMDETQDISLPGKKDVRRNSGGHSEYNELPNGISAGEYFVNFSSP